MTFTLPFIRSLKAGSVPFVGYEQSLTPHGLSGDNSHKFTITCRLGITWTTSRYLPCKYRPHWSHFTHSFLTNDIKDGGGTDVYSQSLTRKKLVTETPANAIVICFPINLNCPFLRKCFTPNTTNIFCDSSCLVPELISDEPIMTSTLLTSSCIFLVPVPG